MQHDPRTVAALHALAFMRRVLARSKKLDKLLGDDECFEMAGIIETFEQLYQVELSDLKEQWSERAIRKLLGELVE